MELLMVWLFGILLGFSGGCWFAACFFGFTVRKHAQTGRPLEIAKTPYMIKRHTYRTETKIIYPDEFGSQ